MTSLPCVKTLLPIMFWKWFQFCYHIALSVFMKLKIRFLEGKVLVSGTDYGRISGLYCMFQHWQA